MYQTRIATSLGAILLASCATEGNERGQNTKPGVLSSDFPVVTQSMLIEIAESKAHHASCTGSIIGGGWAITAAHCTNGDGTFWVSTSASPKRKVVRAIPHPNYPCASALSKCDVALFKIETDSAGLKIPTTKPQEFGYVGALDHMARRAVAIEVDGPAAGSGCGSDLVLCGEIARGALCRGDSGSPLVNGDQLVGVHKGRLRRPGQQDCAREGDNIVLSSTYGVRDWICETTRSQANGC